VFELMHHEAADGRASPLPLRLPQLTYLALALFTHPVAAVEIVTEPGTKNVEGGAARAIA
jgi:hypothetical protein